MDEQKVKEALDLALQHFPERLDRAFELIRAQAELLGIELPEGFGTVGEEIKPEANESLTEFLARAKKQLEIDDD